MHRTGANTSASAEHGMLTAAGPELPGRSSAVHMQQPHLQALKEGHLSVRGCGTLQASIANRAGAFLPLVGVELPVWRCMGVPGCTPLHIRGLVGCVIRW